jgi:DnaJ family protein C protein 13
LDLLDFLREKVEIITGFATAESKKPTIPAKPKPPKDENLIVDLSDLDWVDVKTAGNQLSPVEQGDMVLDALSNVLLHNPGIEIILLGQFSLIFQFLRAHQHPSIQIKALNIISIAASNKECVSDIAASFQLGSMLVLIAKLHKSVNTIFRTLIALSSNGSIVKALLEYGGLVYILNVFCDPQLSTEYRLLAAELLAKLQSDKLTGPRWTRFIIRYLPPIFGDALRDNSGNAIQMFDSTTESPELIWNDNIRKAIRQNIQTSVNELSTLHLSDPGAKWNAPNAEETLYQSVVEGEIIVGGVYIRLFNTNPSWTVRHPKNFCTELMEKILELMQSPNDQLEPITTALCSLIQFNKAIADQIPSQGYLPQFCTAMASSNSRASKTALLILNELATNDYCSETLSNLPIIKGILVCMKQQSSLIGEAAHVLKFLTKKSSSELAQQFLSSGIIPYLLDLLSSNLPQVNNPGAAKAEIVDALKQVARDLQYGSQITDILEKSTIWSQYKDQRHDLFLPASRTQAITGPANVGVAGYLTNNMFNPPPSTNEPPPRNS